MGTARWSRCWRPTGATLLYACACWALASCTRVSDTERFAPNDEALAIVQTVPAAGARDVARDSAIDLCFSHIVDPRSLAPTDASISSGETAIDSESSLQLVPWTDPGGADVAGADQPWCLGSVLSVRPKAALLSALHYRLRFVPRVRGWNGEILDTEADGWTPEGDRRRYYLEFSVDPAPDALREDDGGSGTDGDPTDGPAEADGPTLADLFAPGEIFDPERATCSCHRDPEDLAFARLDLRDASRAYDALVLDGRLRETGFALVAPRRPSESFLVQKLLRDHDGDPLQGILGDAMPPDMPLPYADYVMIARWIAAGAMP